MHTKILIEVRGGCIQEIISNNPAMDITIVDWDNPSHETGCEITEKTDAEIDALITKYDEQIFNAGKEE
jgi:hypothetical protein